MAGMKCLRRASLPLLLAALLLLAASAPLRPTFAASEPAASGAALAQATADVPADAKATPEGKATPAPEVVKLEVDQALSEHLAKLLDFQTQFFKTYGRFYQALDSHSEPPADGKLVPPDLLDTKPTNETEKSADLWQQLTLDPALPYSSRVDVYQGPEGWGYVLTVSATLNKETWERSINTGPERYREQGWHVVVSP